MKKPTLLRNLPIKGNKKADQEFYSAHRKLLFHRLIQDNKGIKSIVDESAPHY